MNWTVSCACVIPCLNEAGTIAGVVAGVRRHLPTVIVVDDGSRDNTAQVAAAAGAKVVCHDKPMGKGAALCSGWNTAAEQGLVDQVLPLEEIAQTITAMIREE